LRFLCIKRNLTDRHADVPTDVGRKGGKTTLTSILLQRLGAGWASAGRPVAAAGAVVVPEEPLHPWRQGDMRVGFGPKVTI
jgi:hypothetical protein